MHSVLRRAFSPAPLSSLSPPSQFYWVLSKLSTHCHIYILSLVGTLHNLVLEYIAFGIPPLDIYQFSIYRAFLPWICTQREKGDESGHVAL